jgi:hypothetical protein
MDINDKIVALNEQKRVLEQQLAEAEKERSKLEAIQRQENAANNLKNIGALLSVVKNHSRSSCSDTNACNGDSDDIRCVRCFLLNAHFQDYWDDLIHLNIRLERIYVE